MSFTFAIAKCITMADNKFIFSVFNEFSTKIAKNFQRCVFESYWMVDIVV